MALLQISGPSPLYGEISIQGSKNAVLPMMAAAVLHKGITVLTNVPIIQDVACMKDILEALGCRCCQKGDCLMIDARFLKASRVPREYMTAMRSSIIVLGALIGRLREGSCCYPGGCLIGERPIDLHLSVLKSLGVSVKEEEGWIEAECSPRKLLGTEIILPYPSVGATEQAILAAVLAEEVTVIHHAAMEPEISQLCCFLNNMGAVICGMGTDHLMVQGVKALHDSSFRIEGDRIVAGTYGAAVAAARGHVAVKGIKPSWLEMPLRMLERAGAQVRREEDAGRFDIRMERRPWALTLKTGPYPAFPTDLQSPFMALLAGAEGESRIEETVFEGRFATAFGLRAMGAAIRCHQGMAVITGKTPLKGAQVEAADLRGGAALAVAALAAEGETLISGCHHICRGYEDIARDLKALGAPAFWLGQHETR